MQKFVKKKYCNRSCLEETDFFFFLNQKETKKEKKLFRELK